MQSWGMTTGETTAALQKEMGDPALSVACIGPAGERLVRFAAVINETSRAAGRGGLGAVMGSMNLKAGCSREDDTLPPRLLEEPLTEGAPKGRVWEREPLLDEYYRVRGWDLEGLPTAEKLREVGLRENGVAIP